MYFKFSVYLNDNDYLEYNTFWNIRSPYGKKQILGARILLAVFFLAIVFASLYSAGFSVPGLLGVTPYFIALVLAEVFLNKFFILCLKGQIKSLKKNGKPAYSPVSEMEFYEESFVEITPDGSMSQKYSSVERVSIITDKVIYIHVNNIMSFILPISSFNSKEQYDGFLSFIKTKCRNIDVY